MRNQKETTDFLLQFWNIDQLKFSAVFFLNSQGKGSFREIKKPDGSRCIFPDNTTVTISVRADEVGRYEVDKEYVIHAFVAPDGRRADIGKEFLLYIDTLKKPPKKIELEPRQYIRKLYREYRSAIGIARDTIIGSISRLSSETNKKQETFIYELLQNADDYPDPKRGKVNVRFKLTDEYFVVVHNGAPFSQANVRAICTVAARDKEMDLNKTGFKGIGFKSIFKYCNYVWVHSGEFSFRFDEQAHRAGGEDTFWQLIPLWTELEDIDESLKTNEILGAPVSFVIKPKEGLERLLEFEKIILKVFQDERVLLFLRHVQSLNFVTKQTNFTVAKSLENWEISDLDYVEVPETVKNNLNRAIKLNDDRVPEKYEDIQRTKISFATRKKDKKVAITEAAHLYAYLPTDLDFGLPFLINGDFIPDGSRDRLFWDIEWNQFLFQQAGYQFVKWIAVYFKEKRDYGVVRLIPDLNHLIESEKDDNKRAYLSMFKEGLIEGIKEIPFVPDLNDALYKLEDLLYDETGLCNLLGEDLFKELTGIDKPIINPHYCKSIIFDLMEEHELGQRYKKDDLLELISEFDFRQWLGKIDNNVKFLNLLHKKGWLEDFNDEEIYLSNQGELCKCSELYNNLGEDDALLDWLNIKTINPKLLNLKINVACKTYSPLSFITNYILVNKQDVDALLLEKENNLKFYQYLYKYYKQIADSYYTNENLLYFRVWGNSGEVISSLHDDGVYLPTEELLNLMVNRCLPEKETLAVDQQLYSSIPDLAFWAKLSVEQLSETSTQAFLEKHLTAKPNELSAHYQSTDDESNGNLLEEKQTANKVLWEFVFKSLQFVAPANKKGLCELLSKLPVFTTNENEVQPLQNCYLPSQYTGNNDLENLLQEYADIEVVFLSEMYLENSGLKKESWIQLFKECGVKTDIEDLLLSHIIPSISTISEENLIATTRLLFKYRKSLEKVLGSIKIKIKTKESTWEEASAVFLGEYYTNSTTCNDVLPSIVLSNEVSEEYTTSKHSQWAEFLTSLGAKVYLEETQVINKKIDQFLQHQTSISDQKIFLQIGKELAYLHKNNKLNNDCIKKLSSILVITTSGSLVNSELCQFCKAYNPQLDLETMLTKEGITFNFLSSQYLEDSAKVEDLSNFFKQIGVKENFEIVNKGKKPRNELNTGYLAALEASNPRIKSNANQGWSGQHRIDPYHELLYMEFLSIYGVAKAFWKRLLKFEGFRKSVFSKFTYLYYFGPTQVISYIEWYITNNATLPALDGKCYKPTQLYSYNLKDAISDKSKVAALDLSTISIENKTLEEYLGIKQKIGFQFVIQRINELKDFNRLKNEGTWQLLLEWLQQGVKNLTLTEQALIVSFKATGQLPNQLRQWKPISQLYCISTDFDLGIGNNEWIINNEISSIATCFGITELKSSDFNPSFKEPVSQNTKIFKDTFLKRVNFIALAEDENDWQTLADAYTVVVQRHNFYQQARISFSYDKVTPPIENTEKTFYKEDNDVYYVGSWDGPRAIELFKFIHSILALKRVSLKILQDLLLNDIEEILEFFDERNIFYPLEWKLVSITDISTGTISTNTITTVQTVKESGIIDENKDLKGKVPVPNPTNNVFELTANEIDQLSKLLKNSLSDDQKQDQNLLALLRGIETFRAMGYKVDEAEKCFEETYKKRLIDGVVSPDGKRYRVLCRSAVGQMLHISYSAWFNLGEPNTLLYVLKDNSGDYEIFHTRADLSKFNEDSWIIKLNGEDKLVEIEELFGGAIEPGAPLDILVRVNRTKEYDSIFKNIYNKETERQKFDEATSKDNNLDIF